MAELYLGLDIGGTKVAVGLVDGAGRVAAQARRSTESLRQEGEFVPALLRLARSVAGERPAGVGIALPGPVDPRRGVIRRAPRNQELEGVPLAEICAQELGCPAVADNDANCAALAEARFGAGRGAASLAYFTVSTGIGGGFIVEGRPLSGRQGTAAEFGHVILSPQGPRCDCGGRGCLEALASGSAIARSAREAAAAVPGSRLASAEFLAGRPLDAARVDEAAQAGDAAAQRVWEEAMTWLGLGVATVINVLDPAVVVLGGGVTAAGERLLVPVRRVVAERCMPDIARETPIRQAELGAEVGIVGAAALVMGQ